VAVAFEGAARTVGLDVSFMPEGYTREQDEALWAAGYESEELGALAALWGTDRIETKARTGQMLLDGLEVPVAPGSVPSYNPGEDQAEAFWAAGYTYEDLTVLTELWGLEHFDAKVRAGQAVLDGEALPITPGSAPSPAVTAPVDPPPAVGPAPGDG